MAYSKDFGSDYSHRMVRKRPRDDNEGECSKDQSLFWIRFPTAVIKPPSPTMCTPDVTHRCSSLQAWAVQ